jgi:hypothetical protein
MSSRERQSTKEEYTDAIGKRSKAMGVSIERSDGGREEVERIGGKIRAREAAGGGSCEGTGAMGSNAGGDPWTPHNTEWGSPHPYFM